MKKTGATPDARACVSPLGVCLGATRPDARRVSLGGPAGGVRPYLQRVHLLLEFMPGTPVCESSCDLYGVSACMQGSSRNGAGSTAVWSITMTDVLGLNKFTCCCGGRPGFHHRACSNDVRAVSLILCPRVYIICIYACVCVCLCVYIFHNPARDGWPKRSEIDRFATPSAHVPPGPEVAPPRGKSQVRKKTGHQGP